MDSSNYSSSSPTLILNGMVHACMLSCFSHVQLFATLWTVACHAPLSMGFPRQEYWGIFLAQRLKSPVSLCLLHWQPGSLPQAPPGKPQMAWYPFLYCHIKLVFLLSTFLNVLPPCGQHFPKSTGYDTGQVWAELYAAHSSWWDTVCVHV